MRNIKSPIVKLLDRIIADDIPRNLDIEVCSACNHRCVYCPVHDDPFRQKVMTMADFTAILDKLKGIPYFKRIALNHYNEPFMDPHLIDRIHEIFSRNITRWIILYTNASMIRKEQLQEWLPYRKQLGFNINLPTVISENRYKTVHGRDDLQKVENNIELLLKMGFLVQINVQENHHTTVQDYESVLTKYGKKVKKIRWVRSSTRSNLTLNEKYYHSGRIIGCTLFRHTNYLHIGVDGEVFLCAEDYYKKHQFGNILKDSLSSILSNPSRKEFLDYLSGRKKAPADFLCRSCRHAIVEENSIQPSRNNNWLLEAVNSNNLFNKF